MSTVNVPILCYNLVVSEMASLIELQTVYGLEDAYDLAEILAVRNANERILSPRE